MLWAAGQRRLERERQERLVALFATGRDAYVAAHARKPYVPSYLQAAAPRAQAGDVAAYRATLARLGAAAPGRVKVN